MPIGKLEAGEYTSCAKTVARFTRLVEVVGECWLWRGAKSGGQFRLFGHARSAALSSWVLFKGKAPEKPIWRSCANSLCVRPDHLTTEVRLMRPVADRFWEKVEKSDTCWLWCGATNKSGYGDFHLGGGSAHVLAHRYSWELHNGSTNLFVLHDCDNPPCVRPDHLFLGTNKDNMLDMARKGRHGLSKLTAAQARQIKDRCASESHRALGEEFGVSRPTVTAISTGRNWRHV